MIRSTGLALAALVAAAAAPAWAQSGTMHMPASTMNMPAAHMNMPMMAEKPAHFAPTRQAYTTNHQFLVKLLSVPRPIPFEKYFTLRLAVYDPKYPAQPLPDAKLPWTTGRSTRRPSSPRFTAIRRSGRHPSPARIRWPTSAGRRLRPVPVLRSRFLRQRQDRVRLLPSAEPRLHRRQSLAKGLGLGTRHTPTLLDAAFNHWYFWDGRTDSLWSQALQPFENPRETGGDRLHIVHVVADDPALRQAYRRLFGPLPPLADNQRFPAHARPDVNPNLPVAKAWAAMAPADRIAVDRMFSNLGKAIEAYERKLVSGNSPFDRYVEGLRTGNAAKEAALSPAAKRGLKLFVGAANCELCHSGPDFTDGQFHNIGLPLLPGEAADPGRAAGIRAVEADPFNGVGRFSDDPKGAAKDRLAFLPPPPAQRGAFKTPSLRNVALTAPYMHDGRFATLGQVLDFYAEGKKASRGRLVGTREATLDLIPPLNAGQKADLIAFLRSLTGAPLPRALLQPPPRPRARVREYGLHP